MDSYRFVIPFVLLIIGPFFTSSSCVFCEEPFIEILIGATEPVVKNPSPGKLNNPFAVEFNSSNEMIIVEYEGGRILSWTKDNGLNHLAGSSRVGYRDGPAETALFDRLHNLSILDDGTMLLSDHLTHSIRRYDPETNIVSTYTGTGKPGPVVEGAHIQTATFNVPICVALTPDKTSLLVADIGNHRVRRIDLRTGLVSTVAGNGQKGKPSNGSIATDSPLVDPRGAIQNEAGEVFIIERGGNSLRMIDVEGKISTLVGNGTAGDRDGDVTRSQLNGPKHLCFGTNGTVFIADDNNNAIRKYDPTTKQLTTVNLGKYEIRRPHGVCVHAGWLYIADSFNHRILRVKL